MIVPTAKSTPELLGLLKQAIWLAVPYPSDKSAKRVVVQIGEDTTDDCQYCASLKGMDLCVVLKIACPEEVPIKNQVKELTQ
jgi:hypothetical protein